MKKQVTEQELIKIANFRLSTMPGYEEGMKIHTASMDRHILKISGEFFLDSDGGATERTKKAMPLYDALVNELGNEYQVCDAT